MNENPDSFDFVEWVLFDNETDRIYEGEVDNTLYFKVYNSLGDVSDNYEIIHSENEGDIPYYVYTPSVVNTEEETPLVIWLHDSWEKGLSELAFTNISLPKMLKEWTMDEFNA